MFSQQVTEGCWSGPVVSPTPGSKIVCGHFKKQLKTHSRVHVTVFLWSTAVLWWTVTCLNFVFLLQFILWKALCEKSFTCVCVWYKECAALSMFCVYCKDTDNQLFVQLEYCSNDSRVLVCVTCWSSKQLYSNHGQSLHICKNSHLINTPKYKCNFAATKIDSRHWNCKNRFIKRKI